MNNRKYHLQLGKTEACTKKIMEATKGIGQREIKGANNYCSIFDSCLSSKKSSEAVMVVGADIIGMVKTNTKGFCKYEV